MKNLIHSFFIFCLFCLNTNSVASAQTSVEEELRVMKAQFETMRQRIEELEATVAQQQTQVDTQAQPPAIAQPSQPNLKWLPDIGVVADTVFTLDSAKEDEEGADRVSLRELELVLGSAVDPYSRLDATISFSDTEDPSLEEAYLTRFGLPLDTTARLGKFKPKVGKAITVHRDSLDTVDEPLVIQRYFGVEGLSKSGVDLSTNLNLPLPVTQQLSLGVLEGGNGEEGTAFGETRRRPTLYAHLKNYWDLTETTGLELGFSGMSGSRDEDSAFEVQVLASDLTLKHDLNPRQSFKLQGEVFNLNREDSFLDVDEDDGMGGTVTNRYDVDGNLWGWYGFADFRFHPQWAAGFRYDNVQLVNDGLENLNKDDSGYTGYLTFYQSEFARWRAQYTHQDLATSDKDNHIFYIQGTFAIGEHKHKIQ